MNTTTTDYQKVLTEVLQKQIVILGPAITLAKARNVTGLQVADDGKVLSMEGDGHALSVKLLEQFRELSPLLVKKTMRTLLSAILYSPNAQPLPHAAVTTTSPPQLEKHEQPQPKEQNNLPAT